MGRPTEQENRFVLTGRRLMPFAPRFEERIQPEVYRFSGRVRLLVVSLMIFFNIATGFSAKRLGFDLDLFIRYHTFNIPLLVVDVALAWVIWRGRLSVTAMRRLTYVCVTCEGVSSLGSVWLFGSVNSHMIVFGMLMVLIYRAFFDYNTGLYTFLLLVLGHWAIVGLESFGVIPVAPLFATPPTGMPISARSGAMIMITLMQGITFVVANLVVVRLHHKELAIRILRESLAAVEPGEVGRHTGRTLCDTYELGRLLGTGGMGEVYRGKHRRTQRAVAVKMLHSQLLDDSSLLKRFRREAEITGSLGSEHIVEIIDIDQDGDQPFIVFELLEGTSLAAYIAERGALPFDELEEVIAQTAKGLAVAHDAGVVHRDLKPANLFLVDRDGRRVVKILDFGVSKIQGEATAITRELALLGTPDFMAPEQTVGAVSDIGGRTDIFALGAIAYNAVTGVKPFMASSIPALLRRICDEEPVPAHKLRKELPADVETVLAIAMAKRAAERYASATEMAGDLSAALHGRLGEDVRERAAAVHRGAPASRTAASSPLVDGTGDTVEADVSRSAR